MIETKFVEGGHTKLKLFNSIEDIWVYVEENSDITELFVKNKYGNWSRLL